MKSVLPLLSVLLFAASCTTAYKSGQTPDDVYYSPSRPVQEYAQNDKEEEEDRYISPEEREERYVRMKQRNRRWADLEDDYTYRPVYTYTVNPWIDYNHWNYYYNPYCCCNTPTKVPVKTAYNKPRTFNLGVYTPPVRSNVPPVKGTATRNSSDNQNSNYRGSNQSAGSWLRTTLSGSNNNSSNSGNTNTSRPTSIPSSGSSNSGSSGTPAKAPVRKF